MNILNASPSGPKTGTRTANQLDLLRGQPWSALAILIVLAMAGAGCKMTSSTHDMEDSVHAREDVAVTQQQLRLRMRALVEPLSGAIVESADQIMAGTTNRVIQRGALVWKMEAVPALREALFRPNPFAAIMDTWVLTWQMTDYFESGQGQEALGTAAPIAVTTCQYLENQVDTVTASMMISGDVSDARAFARQWAKEHPIRHSIASRESTLSRVTERQLQETFSTQELAGNVVVTLDDLTRRMDIYSAQLFDQARWQAELVALDLAEDYQLDKALPLAETAVQAATQAVATVKRLEPVVADALVVARSAPEVISRERTAAIEAVHAELSRTIEFVQEERAITLEHLTGEREATLEELRQTIIAERQVLTTTAEEISRRAVDHAILRIAQLTGAVLLIAFLGLIVLLFIVRRMFTAQPTQTPPTKS